MIVVTAPTGNIGKELLKHLLHGSEQIRVIARDPSKLPAEVQGKVDVIQGSHADADVVTKAFQGADSVFWLVPPDTKAASMEAAYVDFTRPACEAIQKEGVKRVVTVSTLGRGTKWAGHAGLVTAALAMDDLIASTGVHLRALALPSFMDNLLAQAGAIKEHGMFFSPLAADRKFPSIATVDIAAASAKYLVDPNWTGQAEVPVVGPDDLTLNETAQILSEVLGKPVSFKQVPMEAFKGQLAGFGMSPAVVEAFADMMNAKNEGSDTEGPRAHEERGSTSFRQWCESVLKPAVLS